MAVRAVAIDAGLLPAQGPPWPELGDGVTVVALGAGVLVDQMFAVAAASVGCRPWEVVAVGSDPAYVEAAQRAGCRAVWVVAGDVPLPPALEPDGRIEGLAELGDAIGGLQRKEQDDAGVIGVGPHPVPWPDDDHLDPELLAAGDRRNVVDRYRYWREADIAADLAARAHPFHVAVENWRSDHNIGAVVRNANAFGAACVHMIGRRRWNRRGAMATDRYLPVRHHDTIEAFTGWAAREGLVVVGVDNIEGSVPIETFEFPRRTVLLFGQEGPGLSPPAVDACVAVCAIGQFGSTRSLNAGVASGIAMHAWIRTHA